MRRRQARLYETAPDTRFWRLRGRLSRPVSIQSLVALRILFGLILVWDWWRYERYDRIDRYYVHTEFTFPYFGLDFIQPLPDPWIHWAWAVVGLSAFLVMIGAFYRVAIVTFILSFGYFFLLDRTQYLNHNYMVLLYAALLAVSPANRAFSVDARLRPHIRTLTIPYWPVAAVRLQTEIILVYAGIVKITDDWLRGEPLRMWMHARMDEIPLAQIFQWDWVLMSAAIGVVVLHVVGAPLLLWRRSRLAVFLIYTAFHVTNSVMFNIGIFPWLTIAVTLIFFEPDWPQRLARRFLGLFEELPPPPRLRPDAPIPRLGTAALAGLALWFAVQLALPMRQALFPNLVGWTGDGHRFSWRMRIYDRDAQGYFRVVSPSGGSWAVEPQELLSRRQARNVLTRPDLIYDFAQLLEELSRRRGLSDVQVYAHIRKSLNGRPMQDYVDSSVDLTEARYNVWGPDDWILPLESRAAEGRIAAWWPPLPLQKPAADPPERQVAMEGGN